MATHKIAFKPGVIKDDTPLAAEGGWIDADKVRFRRSRPETIGGWAKLTTDTFTGVARGALAWPTLAGDSVLAFGTQSKLQAIIGGTLTDITPPHSEHTLFNPFTTTNASSSVTVTNTVYTPSLGTSTAAPHGLRAGGSVTFAFADAVGGLTITGTYAIDTVPTPSTFTFTAGSSATSSATGGGYVYFSSVLPAGNLDGSGASGFGGGTYGTGAYGAAGGYDALPRTWALAPWGEFLLANPNGYGLYEFQPAATYPELALNGAFGSSASWTLGTGWTIGAGVATKAAGTASNLQQAAPGTIKGGYTYRVSFDMTVSAGTLTFKMDGLSMSQPFSKAGTHTFLFRCPANPTNMQFSGDATFAGTVDNFSIKLESKAYRIIEAPAVAYGLFVDSNRIAVLLATINAAGIFDPLLVRWSDLENNRTWVPTDTNLAGETQLSHGSHIVGAIPTRSQNLIMTDAAAHTMGFTGDTATTFAFNKVGEGCGLLGPLAVAEHSGVAYWMSNTGQFFAFSGGSPQVIESSLKHDVFANVAPYQEAKSFVWINSQFGEVWFHYADGRDGNECSRYAIFSIPETHWTPGTFNRSCFIPTGIFRNPVGLGIDGYIYNHETGNSGDGGVLTAFVKSGLLDVDDGDDLMAVRRVSLDLKDQLGAVSVTMYGRSFPPDTETPVGPFVFSPTTSFADMRLLAREISIKISSSATPSRWRIGTLMVEGQSVRAKR